MKKRVLYYDFLNIFAIIGVVFLHSNGLAHNFSNTLAWHQAFLVEVLFFWPVPVFFMLSGANLMGYRQRYSTKEFLKKRFSKTMIPFIIWSCINAYFFKVNPFEIGIIEFINRIIGTSIQNIYWFFIPLFAVYLSLPVISLLKDNRKILWYTVTLSFGLTSFLPFVLQLFGIRWNSMLNLPVASGYLLFVILGYLISTEDLSLKKRIAIYIMGAAGVIIRFLVTVIKSINDGTMYRGYFDYMGYYSVFLALAVFVFFRYSKTIEKMGSNPKICRIVKEISGCSFGVYLIHMLVHIPLVKIMPTNCWEWRLLVPFLIYAISLAATYLLKKIPVIKHIVP